MRQSRVAKRYAHALFQFATEKERLDNVAADLVILAKEYQTVPELRQLIDSPVIPNETKARALKAAFQAQLDDLTLRFILLLVNKNREMILPDIINYFQKLLDDFKGVLRGEVFSVVPLSEDQLQKLKEVFDKQTGKNVILTQKIDPTVLGGFVVKIRDMVIDSSLRHQLIRLKDALAGSVS